MGFWNLMELQGNLFIGFVEFTHPRICSEPDPSAAKRGRIRGFKERSYDEGGLRVFRIGFTSSTISDSQACKPGPQSPATDGTGQKIHRSKDLSACELRMKSRARSKQGAKSCV